MKLAAENGFSSLNRAAKSDHCLNGAPTVRFYLLLYQQLISCNGVKYTRK